MGSTGRCNDGGQSISWSLIAKRLARTAIEPSRDAIELRLAYLREVRALRQVLAQQAVTYYYQEPLVFEFVAAQPRESLTWFQ